MTLKQVIMDLVDYLSSCLHFHCLNLQDEIQDRFDLLGRIYSDNPIGKRSDFSCARW